MYDFPTVLFLSLLYGFVRNTLDFWLSSTRDGEAARCFFVKMLVASHPSSPRVINVDKNAAYPKAFNALKAAGHLPESGELRQ